MAGLDADRYVLGLEEIDRTQTAVAGGKNARLEGGAQARDAIRAYLATYGMRCAVIAREYGLPAVVGSSTPRS